MIPIRVDNVGLTYAGAMSPVLSHVELSVEEGELLVVVGPTGSGKTTLLRLMCGLVPHFSGGTLTGQVTVGGRSTSDVPPRELADIVGFVPQNPADSFVCDTVEEELAYVMENLGVAPVVMRRRVEETLDLLGIADLRTREIWSLSGGQQQRVAIAAVLTASPRILILDEPTSSLDPAAAEDVLAAIGRLVHDVGLTVVMSEHRLERVIHLADRVVVVDGPVPRVSDPAVAMIDSPVAPPVVHLGRAMGWDPLPLSIRDARRAAASLRVALEGREPEGWAPAGPESAGSSSARAEPVVEAAGLVVRYGSRAAVSGLDLAAGAGEIVAIMGRNGSGKSTLLATLAGLMTPQHGRVRIDGEDPARLTGGERIQRIGLVPQDPGALLYSSTVDHECRTADREGHLEPGATRAVLDLLVPDIDPDVHPRDLSEGQRLGLALAVVTAHHPVVLLLDEPTRGLDDLAKDRLAELMGELSRSGTCVIFATHDTELASRSAHRIVVLADGEVIADGPARDVACHSTVFAPQVARIMAPAAWLTVAEVVEAVGART